MSDQVCPNCGKAVSASAFCLHEARCSRVRFKCECGEVVDNSEKAAHEETKHADVVCEHCKLKGKAYVVDKHECRSKPILCKFCEGHIASDLYTSHIESCGNQTTPCDLCGNYVRKKEFESHVASHASRSVEEEKPPKHRPYLHYTLPATIRRPHDPGKGLAVPEKVASPSRLPRAPKRKQKANALNPMLHSSRLP